MQQHSSLLERISKAMRRQFDAIAREPLPERWVDLIKHLNEQERRQAQAQPPAARRPACTSERKARAD